MQAWVWWLCWLLSSKLTKCIVPVDLVVYQSKQNFVKAFFNVYQTALAGLSKKPHLLLYSPETFIFIPINLVIFFFPLLALPHF
jgi:hypothetical protein